MTDLEKRYANMLKPSERLINDIKQLDGDILFLGVA